MTELSWETGSRVGTPIQVCSLRLTPHERTDRMPPAAAWGGHVGSAPDCATPRAQRAATSREISPSGPVRGGIALLARDAQGVMHVAACATVVFGEGTFFRSTLRPGR